MLKAVLEAFEEEVVRRVPLTTGLIKEINKGRRDGGGRIIKGLNVHRLAGVERRDRPRPSRLFASIAAPAAREVASLAGLGAPV